MRICLRRRRLSLLLFITFLPVLGLGGRPPGGAPLGDASAWAAAAPEGRGNGGVVSVLYAGSLVNLMEKDLGPAFSRATGYTYQGEGKGSVALANMIKDRLRRPDIFLSADPKVNELLMGPENGNLVRWYATIFRNEMVLAYNPRSRFAGQFEQARAGQLPLFQVLGRSGLRLGRTDPRLDPKGYRTLFLFTLAERYYHQPGLTRKILGDPENAAQIYPEEELVARLETGQLDAGIFYRNEAAEHRLPYIPFPLEINLSDPALDAEYRMATYVGPKGKTYRGGAVIYTITIPETSRQPEGAVAFIRFLLSPEGRRILMEHGFPLVRPVASGDKEAVPAGLRTALEGELVR